VIQDHLGERSLRMQGVGGDDAAAQGQVREEGLRQGDLVGLVVDAHLRQRFLGVVGGRREQVGGRLGDGHGAAHHLAVEGEQLTVARRPRLAHPGGQHPLQLRDGEAGEQPAVEGTGKGVRPLVGEVAGEQGAMLIAPRTDRGGRVTVAQQGCDQAGERLPFTLVLCIAAPAAILTLTTVWRASCVVR